MTAWWQTLIAVTGGLLLLWAALVVGLYFLGRREARRVQLREALRLLPDLLRLLRRLASDPDLPRGARVRLAALLAYLALPIDLVPDFVPLVGYADDVVIIALVLRSVINRAGVHAIERHWPGNDDGLRSVLRLAGIAEGKRTTTQDGPSP
jgi:uncharacterized membrane protein YkvA (DUF1232 family)